MDQFIFEAHAYATPLCYVDEMVVGAFDKIWPFIGFGVFGMFIYGGAMWMMSTGDPQKLAKAQGVLIWTVVGAAILAALMLIMGTFEGILGLPQGSLRGFDIDCMAPVVVV